MIKKVYIGLLSISMLGFSGCAELQNVVNNLPQQTGIGVTQNDIANGLKQALNQGIDKQVSQLTQVNGFYGDNAVKILLPQELQKVEQGLRAVGLGNLADEGIKSLNRAAENAVKEATPIFVNAIQQMSFADAKNILMGADDSATTYLENKTSQQLYNKFEPIIKSSFNKVGADEIWSNIINKYNSLPLVQKVNPDLTDYVAQEALKGVFKKIAVEEKQIRNSYTSRTTDLLKRVFALQDQK